MVSAGLGVDKPLSLEALLASPRPRELEQLSYTFAVSGLTLSGTFQLGLQRREQLQQLLGQLTGDIAQLRDHPALPQAGPADPGRLLERAHRAAGLGADKSLSLEALLASPRPREPAKGVGKQEPGVLLRHVRVQ
mgnify:CR=1 FL=1